MVKCVSCKYNDDCIRVRDLEYCSEYRPKPAAEYVAKRDVIALLKNYAHRCIDAGRLTLDVVDDTAALTCLVEAMPAARGKEEDDKS